MGSAVVKPRTNQGEIGCKPFISAGDFNDFLKKHHENLSADDVECLVAARDELRKHGMQVWRSAEFYVQGEQNSFVFWTGKRKNKFICYRQRLGQGQTPAAATTSRGNATANGDSADKIIIYCELGGSSSSTTVSKTHRLDAEQIDCTPYLSASDFNSFLYERADLTKQEVTLLQRAREELKKHRRWLMVNAEFFVQARTRSFRFVAGTGSNKFICYDAASSESRGECQPVVYLEQGGITKSTKKLSETETSPAHDAAQDDDVHEDEMTGSTSTTAGPGARGAGNVAATLARGALNVLTGR